MLTFFYSYNMWAVWFLQLAVGIIFIVHGKTKLKKGNKFIAVGGSLHGLVEVVGGLALIASFQVQLVGLIFSIIMLGAIWFKKFQWHMPFMAQDKTGWEFDFVLLAANLFFLTK